ncbi:MAG: hypothetical protein EB084_24475, partial [Proteobacteria bacterium]|nr:hypothetical protein [Pseudomonadota bacterium]
MTAARWLASLVARLRVAGIAVPPASLVDAGRVLVETGDLATDRESLGCMLGITLAHTRSARLIFDRVFATFIAAHGPPRARSRKGFKGHAGAVDMGVGGAGGTSAATTERVVSGLPNDASMRAGRVGTPDAKRDAGERSASARGGGGRAHDAARRARSGGDASGSDGHAQNATLAEDFGGEWLPQIEDSSSVFSAWAEMQWR